MTAGLAFPGSRHPEHEALRSEPASAIFTAGESSQDSGYRVTTLPAKAGSFSGHARADAPRFVLKAPSEPQYIQRGVNVPVGYVSAWAYVYPVRERFLDLRESTTRATRLRSVPRVYRDNSRTSFFRFVRKYVQERCPSRVMRSLGKSSPGDALDVEGFVADETVGIHQPSRLFVVEVSALVRRLLVKARNLLTSFAAATRTLLLSGHGTLCPTEFLLRLSVVARWLYGLSIRGNHERLESEIYANRCAVSGRFGHISEIAGEDNVPLPASPLYRDCLDGPFDRAMQLYLDVSDILEIKPGGASGFLEPASVSVGRELDAPEPIFRFEPGITRSVARVHTAEERLERLIQSAKRSLSGRKVQSREARHNLTSFLESPRLLTVGNGTLLNPVHLPAFAQSKIVEAAMRLKHRIQTLRLRAVRVEAIFVGPSHLLGLAPGFLSGDVSRYRLIRDVARCAHVVRPAPEARHTTLEVRVAAPENPGSIPLELVSELRGRILWRSLHEQVNVVGLNREVLDLYLKLGSLVSKQLFEVCSYIASQYPKTIFRTPNEMIVEVRDAARCRLIDHKGNIPDSYTESNHLTARKGGARGFLCRLKTTVPAT